MDNSTPSEPSFHAQEKLDAGEFLETTATQITEWLRQTQAAMKGRRWILHAVLADGTRLSIDKLVAHGMCTIKLKGQLDDGTPFILVAHMNAVQLLATYEPKQEQEETEAQGHEIGFHTGLREIKVR